MLQLGLIADPIGCIHEASGQQFDIEAEMAGSHVRLFLLGREQIEEQRSQTGLAQPSGDLLVARAVPAAPAPVREEHNPLRSGWNEQLAMECELAGRDCSLLTLFVLCAIEIRFHWFREPEAQSHYAPNHSISPPSGEFKRE